MIHGDPVRSPPTGNNQARLRRAGSTAALIGTVILAYAPSFWSSFVDWDDDIFIRDNILLRLPDGLVRIWTTLEAPQYYPITFSTHWLEYRLWGANARGYAAVNVALHAANAALAWFALLRLGLTPPAAWIAAAVFGLHPLQVGTVAWLAERKNLLAGLFCLLSLLCYLAFYRGAGPRAYVAALVTFVLALLSKSIAVTLVPTIWLIDAILLRRDMDKNTGDSGVRAWQGHLSSVWRLTPFVALAVPLLLLTAQRERALAESYLPLASRPLAAAAAIWFYVGKLIWPHPLLPVYGPWRPDLTDQHWWIALVALLAALGLFAATWRILSPTIRWGISHFLVTLLPASGVVFFGFLQHSAVGDHLVYFALLGPAAVVGEIVAGMGRAAGRLAPRLAATIGLVLVLSMGARTAVQTRQWRDGQTLWSYTLRHKPESAPALAALGRIRLAQSDEAGAFDLFERAVRAAPSSAQAHSNLAAALVSRQEFARAIEHARTALAIRPDFDQAHLNLADALLGAGLAAAAVPHAQAVVAADPHDALARLMLGRALLEASSSSSQPHWQAAAHEQLLKGASTAFDNAELRARLAQLLARCGDLPRALQESRRAVQQDPNSVRVRVVSADLMATSGDLAGAERQYLDALRLKPEDASANHNYGALLLGRGDSDAAVRRFVTALSSRPDSADTHFLLAVALMRLGRPADALPHARQAAQLRPDDAEAQALARQIEARTSVLPGGPTTGGRP